MKDYRIVKARGVSNLTVERTKTFGSVIIGKLNMEMMHILSEAGYSYEKGTLPGTSEEWNVEVEDEVAKALISLTFKMHKPERHQSKKATSEQNEEKNTKAKSSIDAFDLIFGT